GALPPTLAITAGAAIYVLWRSERLLVFEAIAGFGLTEPVRQARDRAEPLAPPEWFTSCLPDGLYAFALAWSLAWIWRHDRQWRSAWLAIVAALTLGSECAQALAWLPGTFDLRDAAFYALGLLLGATAPRFASD